MRVSPIVAAAFLLAAAAPAGAQSLKFTKYETKDMCIVYLNDAQDYVLPHMSRCFANSMQFYRNTFGW